MSHIEVIISVNEMFNNPSFNTENILKFLHMNEHFQNWTNFTIMIGTYKCYNHIIKNISILFDSKYFHIIYKIINLIIFF